MTTNFYDRYTLGQFENLERLLGDWLNEALTSGDDSDKSMQAWMRVSAQKAVLDLRYETKTVPLVNRWKQRYTNIKGLRK